MKKTILMVAILAMAMAVAAPIAMAQAERESEQDVESGEVDQSFSVTGSGIPASVRRFSRPPRPATRKTWWVSLMPPAKRVETCRLRKAVPPSP